MGCGLNGTPPPARFWPALAGAIAVALLLVSPVLTQGQRPSAKPLIRLVSGHRAVDGDVLIKYRTAANPSIQSQVEATVDADEREPVGGTGVHRIHSRSLTPDTLVAILRQDPRVEYVEPNYLVTIDGGQAGIAAVPNDSYYGNLYGLPLISAPTAWNRTTGSRANVVAVVDTGVQYTHPDLSANIWSAPSSFTVTIAGRSLTCGAGTHGFNAIAFSTQTGNACDPADDNGHGTHVSGTIGGVGNNAQGVAGVNWTASIMGAKFLSSGGSGSTSDAINAIEFAIQTKAAFAASGGANVRVLSNSWGGPGFSQALLDEINRANTADMLFVAAAGNSGANLDLSPSYPASYTAANLITVAATDRYDARASFSNYSSTAVHIAAPGVSIESTYLNSSYAYLDGTSMATPHVSGAAALVLSACSLTTAQLRTRLLTTVDAVGGLTGIVSTRGRLNVAAAVSACAPPTVTMTTTSVTIGGPVDLSVANGPAQPGDWVGIFASGAADSAYQSWKYLNNAMAMPATGMSSATLRLIAPATAGTYEVRWFSSGVRLATGASFTVIASSASLTVTTPTVALGGTIGVTVASGPAYTTDWVGLFATGTADTAYLSWIYLNGTQTPPASGLSGATLQFPAPATPGSYEIRFFSFNGLTRLAVSSAITVAAPTITVPGSPVTAGQALSFTIAGGPGHASDWVGLYAMGVSDYAPVAWIYLNGTQTRPGSGVTGASLQFTAPATAGSYNIRFFASDGYTRLGVSSTVTVQTIPATVTLSTASVPLNSAFNVTIANDPGSPTDWVGLFASGTTDTSYLAWKYLDGSMTTPAAGRMSATVSFATPPLPGTYEVRLFANNSYTRLGVSGALAVQAPVLALGSNPIPAYSVATVSISGGPANPTDWVGLFSLDAPTDAPYFDWQYLNGSKTPPASGTTSATLSFFVPRGKGSFEFRLFAANGYTRLATSATLTFNNVGPTITATATVHVGGTINYGITDGPGNPTDWVGLNCGESGEEYRAWQYLNGSQTPPAVGMTSATGQFDAGWHAGECQVRFYAANSLVRLPYYESWGPNDPIPPAITMGRTTVTGPIVDVLGGSRLYYLNGLTVSVTVEGYDHGATFNPTDWIGLYRVGSPNSAYLDWQYMNGLKTAPSSGLVGNLLIFPAQQPGLYEFRVFSNNSFTELGASLHANVVSTPY